MSLPFVDYLMVVYTHAATSRHHKRGNSLEIIAQAAALSQHAMKPATRSIQRLPKLKPMLFYASMGFSYYFEYVASVRLLLANNICDFFNCLAAWLFINKLSLSHHEVFFGLWWNRTGTNRNLTTNDNILFQAV